MPPVKNVILICGLNGAGKSTLGRELANKLDCRFVDIEDIYFSAQDNPDYPYENTRSYDEVVHILNDIVGNNENIILASVTGNFGDEFISHINCAVYIDVPKKTRLDRIQKRLDKHFGEKCHIDGSYYEKVKKFHDFCASRDDKLVKNWLSNMICPIINIDGTLPIEKNVEIVINFLRIHESKISGVDPTL